MKKKFFLLSALLTTLLGSAFTIANDILSRLDMQASTAQQFILGNFAGHFDDQVSAGSQDETDRFRIPYSKKMLPAVIAGDKSAAAKELCDYVKLYCNSVEFEKAYAKQRIKALPLSDNGANAGTLMHNIEIYKINIKNYPNDKKYIAEQQQLINEHQARLDNILAQAKGPFELKKEWEATYPADPAVMIRKRLQEYLALVATVDFNAKLAEPDKYKKRKFLNPAYEKKSLKWKAIFRAGKEVNDVVTSFVKEWLKGEIIAKEKVTMPTANTPAKETASTGSTSTSDTKSPATEAAADPEKKPSAPVKEKKALLNKLKNKARAIVD